VQPWIFARLSGLPLTIDYAQIWLRLYSYLLEDFSPPRALGRLKEFTTYYSRNFTFGHQLYAAVQGSTDCGQARDAALAFLERKPQCCTTVSVAGI
jgi:hypothetical protein